MQPTIDISEEDEAFLLDLISKHNKLILEGLDCWREDRLAEIRSSIEGLRVERRRIIEKYRKVEV